MHCKLKSWNYTPVNEADDALVLTGVDVRLELAGLYAGILNEA